jgi:predicted ArsR family transcriptional regulator
MPIDLSYGPSPTPRRPAGLSASRAALLDLLETRPAPATVAAMSRATGLHENTVREHLEALLGEGLVERTRAEAHGRGRPAWLYRAVRDTGPVGEYAGLAAALAAQIQRTSDSPRADAIEAGIAWGRQLAADSAADSAVDSAVDGQGQRHSRSPAEARRRTVALLDGLGFAPQGDDSAAVFRLTRCPLLEAAYRYPDIVCGVHLGIVRGALEEYGGDAERTDLVPFAEPGACLLHLAMPPGAPRRETVA